MRTTLSGHPLPPGVERTIRDLAEAGAYMYRDGDDYGLPTNDADRVLEIVRSHPAAWRDLMVSTERFGANEMLIPLSGPAAAEDNPAFPLVEMAAPLGFPHTVEHVAEDDERRLVYRAPRTRYRAGMPIGSVFCTDPHSEGLSVSGLDGAAFAELPQSITRAMACKVLNEEIDHIFDMGGLPLDQIAEFAAIACEE